MSVFADILDLLTGSPGGLVYYLVLLFSIWSIVGLALSRWSRGEHREIVPRLLVAGAVMSFARFLPTVIALLDRQSGTYLVFLGPPLERFVDALSGLLICWAFVISCRQRTFSRVFVALTAVVSLSLYVIAATQWTSALNANRSLLYNLSWQQWTWELWQLAFLIPALVYLLVVPVQQRGMLIVSLGILTVGHLLQAVYPMADQIPHFAGWVRFANLLAFPILAASAYQLSIQRFDAQAGDLQAINQESLSQITGLMALLDTNQRMSSSLDLDVVLDNAVRGISQALRSDLCAIALVRDDQAGEMELSIVYSAPHTTRGHSRFSVSEFPAIEHAVTRSKPVVLDAAGPAASGKGNQVSQVYRLLNSEESGPLIIQPLERESSVAGVILVCRPDRSALFTPVEARKCETLATLIAATIENASRYRQARAHTDRLTTDLRLLEIEHSRTKVDLENQLEKSKKETALYIQKLYETELSQENTQSEAVDVRKQLARLREQTTAEITQARSELNQSMKQITHLTKRIAALDAARLEVKERVRTLEEEKEDLQFQLTVAATTQAALLDAEPPPGDPQLGKTQGPGGILDAAALDKLACGVIFADPQGRITYVNVAGTRLLGGDTDQWVGTSLFALSDDSLWQSAVHLVSDQYAEDANHPAEVNGFQPIHIEGALGTVRAEVAPLHIAEGHIGAVITLHSVQIAEEQLQARDAFLASLAHDLNTPMTSILGYTELLMNESVGKLEGIQRKFLQRVRANVERMGGMVNDLIGVTTIDSGKLVIEREPVDMVGVIETALRKVQFRLEEKELTTNLRIDTLPVVPADPEHVQQIVDNLLTNACKSSQSGSAISIQARVETDDAGRSGFHFSVSDTGGGIAPEDRSRVFERFYRAETALIAGLGETGVGLAIVKSLVEAHGGRVWNESEMGVGTTFHFTLPLEHSPEASDIETSQTIVASPTDQGNGRG